MRLNLVGVRAADVNWSFVAGGAVGFAAGMGLAAYADSRVLEALLARNRALAAMVEQQDQVVGRASQVLEALERLPGIADHALVSTPSPPRRDDAR